MSNEHPALAAAKRVDQQAAMTPEEHLEAVAWNALLEGMRIRGRQLVTGLDVRRQKVMARVLVDTPDISPANVAVDLSEQGTVADSALVNQMKGIVDDLNKKEEA